MNFFRNYLCRELSDFWDRKETSRHESPCITIRVGRGGAGPDRWGLLGTLLALWDSDFFCRVRAFGALPASGSWILKRPALQPAHGVLFAFSFFGGVLGWVWGAFFIGLGAGALGWIGGDYWERFWLFGIRTSFAASGLLARCPRPGAGY